MRSDWFESTKRGRLRLGRGERGKRGRTPDAHVCGVNRGESLKKRK